MSLKTWREIPLGGLILEAGNSVEYETGEWRAQRPIVDMDECSHCMICWIYCPDSAILVEAQQFLGFDLDHCKGCGICALECPRHCIEMKDESLVRQEALAK